MKTKLVIIGLDRAGKTTVGRLLWLLSFGRIKFADTSKRAWEAESISKGVRVRVKELQKDRLKSGMVGVIARGELARLYDGRALEIFRYILKVSDMYIGLRDMKVLEQMRRTHELKVILVSANFKLARKQNAGYTTADILLLNKEEALYVEAKPEYRINNNGGWLSLSKQVRFLIKDLEENGDLEPIDFYNIVIMGAGLTLGLSYCLFAVIYLLTYIN
jgi:hypothetical protein